MAEIILRKLEDEQKKDTPRKKLVDFLRSSAIITDKFTGEFTLVFNQGGIVGTRKVEKDPI